MFPVAFHFIPFYNSTSGKWGGCNFKNSPTTLNMFAYSKSGKVEYGFVDNGYQPDHLTMMHKKEEYWNHRHDYFNDIEVLGFHTIVRYMRNESVKWVYWNWNDNDNE